MNQGFTGAGPFLPNNRKFPVLRASVQECQGCDLYRDATQAVFGEGSATARIVFVGEQPGNEEDKQGHPFVGPAGHMLDRALQDAGLNRADVYVTNAVKHFRFEERGKRRIHKKPTAAEAAACRPWLEAEVQLLQPEIIVCLGATAAQALLGSKFRLTKERGKPLAHAWGPQVVATIHPSAILRVPDEAGRHEEYARLVSDFKTVRNFLKSPLRGGKEVRQRRKGVSPEPD
jgi:DNA polymerase